MRLYVFIRLPCVTHLPHYSIFHCYISVCITCKYEQKLQYLHQIHIYISRLETYELFHWVLMNYSLKCYRVVYTLLYAQNS